MTFVTFCDIILNMMSNLRQKIRIEMIKQGITGGEIARRLGVDRSAIWHAVSGNIRSSRIRKGICDALGLPMSIWEEMDREQEKAA